MIKKLRIFCNALDTTPCPREDNFFPILSIEWIFQSDHLLDDARDIKSSKGVIKLHRRADPKGVNNVPPHLVPGELLQQGDLGAKF
jgi:hypothetical protein